MADGIVYVHKTSQQSQETLTDCLCGYRDRERRSAASRDETSWPDAGSGASDAADRQGGDAAAAAVGLP